MELASLSSEVVTGNVGSTTGFTMEANAFSFRVLSDGLYQNKIGSMVREVACNALDSHTMAGKPDLPIIIHMPDMYEPYFSVQDMGIGLDDIGVRQTFGTYFASTKRTDNTAVGAFGLGSKTPFAYTDAFNVTAIKDGKKRVYSMYINADGLPDITNMGGESSRAYTLETQPGVFKEILDQWDETDEGNGVTVTVPVTASTDFHRFRTEVQNQLAFFPVKPRLLNLEGREFTWMEWESSDAYMNLENVLVGNYQYGRNFDGLWVVQGPVGYKADASLISQHLSPDNREFLEIIGSCGILKFELGEIEVTPSREGLSYSKKTLTAIENLLDSSRLKMTDEVQAKQDALGDAWATAMGINTDSTLRRLAAITKAKFEFEGYYKSGHFAYIDLEKIADLEGLSKEQEDVVTLGYDAPMDALASEYEGDDEDEDYEDEDNEDDKPTQLADLLNLQFMQYTRQSASRRGRVKKWLAGKPGRHAKVDQSLIIVVRDTAEKPLVRIREFMSTLSSYNLQVYVLQNRYGGPVTEEELDAIKARIGESWKPVLLSDVELPAREKSGYRSGYKCPTAYTFAAGDDPSDTKEWEREYDKLKEFDGAYYVIVDRQRTDAFQSDHIVFDMASAGLLDKPIMAIRQKDADKLADNPDWVAVSVKAKEVIELVKGNKTLINARMLQDISAARIDFMDPDVTEVLRVACNEGKIAKASPLYRLYRLSNLVAKAKTRAKMRGYTSIVSTALRYAGVSVSASGWQELINKHAERLAAPVKDMYPLLTFLGSGRANSYHSPASQAEAIIAYVNDNTGA